MKKNQPQGGYTATETLIYLALLVVLSLALVNGLFVITRSVVSMRLNESMNTASAVVLDRFVREVRQATYLDDTQSTFGTSPGVLMLATATSSATTTVQFLVSGGGVAIKENGGVAQLLTGSTISIESLIFRKASASSSRAVRIELHLRDTRSGTSAVERYYTTALLRGTY